MGRFTGSLLLGPAIIGILIDALCVVAEAEYKKRYPGDPAVRYAES